VSDLPDIKDVGILSGFVMWGNPWHGTVKGGVLNTGKLDAFSTEITRAWPQPPNAFIWLSEKDGQPADAYTAPGAALKAAHAAAGMEFKPWALISGGQVYGKQIGVNKWFYFAGDAVWLVTLTYTQSLDNTDPIEVQISAQRWPEFTADGTHSAAIVKSATLTDIGQAAPDLSALGIAPAMNVYLHDVKKNGSACILSLHTTSTVDSVVPPALGFVLVELSSVAGVFDAVAVSVLKTREQALGTVTANRMYDDFNCFNVPVADTGKCLPGPSKDSVEGGVELIISARLISCFFDEGSGSVAYAAIEYEMATRDVGQSSRVYTLDTFDGSLVWWTLTEKLHPKEGVEKITFTVGGESHLIMDYSVINGTYYENVSTGNMSLANLSVCGTWGCPDDPADAPWKTDSEVLKMRLTAAITVFPCYYPNGDGPVALIKDSLIGTPKGITPVTGAYLDSFEANLSSFQSTLHVAYHPKTGEVIPFRLNPVSFV
jgi:hypothetical protein